MIEKASSELPREPTARRGYEARDLPRKALPIALIGLMSSGLLLHFILNPLYHWMLASARSSSTPRSAVESSQMPWQRKMPPLESEDPEKMRRQEDEVFSRLGWEVNQRSHRAEVPDAVIAALNKSAAASPGASRP